MLNLTLEEQVCMKNLFLVLSCFSMFAGMASAQISFTPRVSHGYHNIKTQTKVVNNAIGGSTVILRDRSYSSSTRVSLEAGYTIGSEIEAILNVGYMPYHKVPGLKADFMNYDLALRKHIGEFYAQAGLGVQTFKYVEYRGASGANTNLPTFGIGAGYIYSLTSALGVDIAYRGYRSIHEGEKVRSTSGTYKSGSAIVDLENHELGLGLRYLF